MVGRQRSSLSVVHQCRLLGISRSSVYYRPVGASQEDLELMREIDRQYMLTPFYGSRRIVAWLKTHLPRRWPWETQFRISGKQKAGATLDAYDGP